MQPQWKRPVCEPISGRETIYRGRLYGQEPHNARDFTTLQSLGAGVQDHSLE
ncbi:hypothetical protein LMG6871_02057 [Ralstonia edaphis]|nr:hypothetical protein LMG6871_02057 [Ralstonia sp. LMG 6871]